MPLDFLTLAQQCAPQISPVTMAAVVRAESGFNPYAIGVVHGRLLWQPTTEAQARVTARALEAQGWRFSVGLAQVNRANWPRYGITEQNAFNPCRNLAAGAAILEGCFLLARRGHGDAQVALRDSLSCYASGNFSTGYRTGYVQRVVNGAQQSVPVSWVNRAPVAPTVPAIAPIPVVRETSEPSADPAPIKSVIDSRPRPDEGVAGAVGQGSAVVF
ncbi:lytic transglycosylase domain-containing protein [Paraburkholderia phenoliruptrix]|uniref:Type IV secretion system protein VirB1 n=2 Tax=Paraburkholderia phenoliruptrix TaxID=252970 RepID=K0DQP1_9BURK|nr:type IV secretion system protein VirB1 [Paraburkholderia phenoliruptrix BR3459a]CAB4048773.1 Type IV secretion system protein virB1 [Paraburkholderia phenoliruptrix]